jgi:redox-sensitive bicupin YhaK (pirin superfamily)
VPVHPQHNAFVHVIAGSVETEGRRSLTDQQLALYERGGDLLRFFAAEEPAEFLVLGGEPLNEPVVSYGPFVMNTRAQIEECFRNYRAGKMGEL